ncbi:MAG: hypothetical protein ACRELG_27645, partial [Gemmataceae bacterium]
MMALFRHPSCLARTGRHTHCRGGKIEATGFDPLSSPIILGNDILVSKGRRAGGVSPLILA